MRIVVELWREARRHPLLLGASILLLLLVFATHLLQAIALAWVLASFVGGTRNGAPRHRRDPRRRCAAHAARACAGRPGRAPGRSGEGRSAGCCGRCGARALAVARHHPARRLDDARARRRDRRHRRLRVEVHPRRRPAHRGQRRRGRPRRRAVAGGGGVRRPRHPARRARPTAVETDAGQPWCRALGHLRGSQRRPSGSLRGMSTLRTLGDVPATRTRLHGRSEALRRATERVMRSSLAETAITDLAVQAGVVAAAGLAVVSVMTGRPPAVEVYALLLLASEAFRPVRDLSRQWHAGFLGLTAVPGLVALGPSREAPCPRRPMSTASPAARRRTPPVGRLLPVPRRGARRAQPHRPPRGARRGACDRRFVRCGQVHAVRRHPRLPPRRIGCRRARRAGAAPLDVAVVSQRPVLFAGTIRENVDLFGVGQEALERACAAAGVLDEIRAVPGGFDAQVRRRERACRAGSGSGSRSPGPCSPAVPCCSSMSRPARSTTRPRRRGGDLARGPQRGSCS